MDSVVKSVKKEKREEMMVNMMPLMMEGIDMNELMPKMMENMLKDVSADDVVDFLKKMLNDNEKLQEIGQKISQVNLMAKMMMKRYPSRFSFDETIRAIEEAAPKNNWHIPDTRDLSALWAESGVEDPPRIRILYFCNAPGGYEMTREDELKVMTVMMPMGVSVYETSEGAVEVAAMNIGMMSGMFSGTTREVLGKSAENLENTMLVIQ